MHHTEKIMPGSRPARRRSRRYAGCAPAPPHARTGMHGPGLIEAISSFAKGEVRISRTRLKCVRATERRYAEVPAGAERSPQNIAGDGMQAVDKLVGARGFEPPTTSTPRRCATRLRYAPLELLPAPGKAAPKAHIIPENTCGRNGIRLCGGQAAPARPQVPG